MGYNISVEKRIKVHNKYSKRCAYCGVKISYEDMQVDHIVPKRRGYSDKELDSYGITRGTNDLQNLNPSCSSCNASKSTFSIEQWRQEISQKHERLLRDNSSYRLMNRFAIVKISKNKVEFYYEKHNG